MGREPRGSLSRRHVPGSPSWAQSLGTPWGAVGGPITGGSPRAAVGKALSVSRAGALREAGRQQQELGAGHPEEFDSPDGLPDFSSSRFWGAWLSSPAAFAAPSHVLALDLAHRSANIIAQLCCYCLFARLLPMQWRTHQLSAQLPGQPEAAPSPGLPRLWRTHW